MKVSLVIPAHNEEGNLENLVNEIAPVLESYDETRDYELVMVNDNSTDHTARIIESLKEKNPRIKTVHRTGTPGFGNAVKAGLKESTGDVIIPVMGDLSDDPHDIPVMVSKIREGNDIVYGSRFIEGGELYEYPFIKKLANRAFNNLVRLMFGIPHKDVTNAFKAYRREVIETLDVDHLEASGFDLTLEIPLKAYIHGFKSCEVPVKWYNRKEGEAKLKLSRNGTIYSRRLLKLFFMGNLVSLRDLFWSVFRGSWLAIVAGCIVGVFLLAFIISLFGFAETTRTFSHISPLWFTFSCGAILTSFLFRTWRWSVILRSAGYVRPPGILFKCIMFGWLLNYLLPARIGDIGRGVALKMTTDAPLGMSLSTIVIERIFDVITLAIILLIPGILFFHQEQLFFVEIGAGALVVFLLGILAVAYYGEAHLVRFLHPRFPKVDASLKTLKEGLKNIISDKPAIVLCLLLSIPVWMTEIASIFFAGISIGVDIPFIYVTIAGITAFIAQSLPVTPAGIGVHEASIAGILALFGIPGQIGLSVALIDHSARALVIYVLGIISAVHIGFASRRWFLNQDKENGST